MFLKKSLVEKLFALLLAFTVILSLTGCYGNVKKSKSASELITFTDVLGREVSVPAGTLDAVALTGSFADVWRLSGGSITATVKDAFDDFNLVLPEAINLGTVKEPNIELVLKANPSFVIASSNTASNIELMPVFERAGITVAYFEIASFDDYLNMLNILTDITGRKDLYEKNGLAVGEGIASAKEKFLEEEIPEEEKTYLLLRASSGFIKAKGSDSYVLGTMLKDLGYKNIADSDETLLENLSIESILKQNPYRIFIIEMGDDTESTIKNVNTMFRENPSWLSLSAIKEGRVHFMEKRLFSLKPNARWGESYEILTSLLKK